MTSKTRFSGDDLRKNDPKFGAPRLQQYLDAVEKLERFARDNYDKRVIHLALCWVLDFAKTNIALRRARWPDQLAPIGGVMGCKIDQNPVGPEFMAPSVELAA